MDRSFAEVKLRSFCVSIVFCSSWLGQETSLCTHGQLVEIKAAGFSCGVFAFSTNLRAEFTVSKGITTWSIES